MKTWIVTGRVAEPATVEPVKTALPTNPTPLVRSNGKSEVGASNEELPSPWQVVSKVGLSDEVEHILDKGVWVATPAMHQGWRIFVAVSHLYFFLGLLLIFCTHGKLREHVLICLHFQTLNHECYSLTEKVCSQCQWDKKTCQYVIVEGEC